MTRMTEDSVYGPPMTPAPKDASVEPDFAALASNADVSMAIRAAREIVKKANRQFRPSAVMARALLRLNAEIAAGRQAAPQPEGGMMDEGNTAPDAMAEGLRYCRRKETLGNKGRWLEDHGETVAAHLDSIAALKVALREKDAALEQCARQFRMYERQHQINGKPDKADLNAAFAIVCEAALTTAGAGKGEK